MGTTTVLVGTALRSWLEELPAAQASGIPGGDEWCDEGDAKEGLVPTGGLLFTYFRSVHLGGAIGASLETTTVVILGLVAVRLMRRRLTRFRVVPLAWMTAAIGIYVVDALDIFVYHLVVH
jgi:hypothetical protein